MTVGNVMRSNDLPVVGPDCGAVEMIHKVSRGGLGLIIIVDNGQIIGIVTDGDIRRAMESREAEFFKIKALDIATRSPKCVNVNAKLIEAERLMTQNKVNSLLATDDEGALCGVIQIYDIKL
jgi:arabinose-5-phosphate isomerase